MPRLGRTFGPDGGVHDLTEKREERDAFVEWLATPKGEREPSSQRKLADALGVNPTTLVRWAKQDDVIAAVEKRRRSVFAVRELTDVWRTLYVQASDPENPRSVAAARLMLDFYEKTAPVEKSEVPLANMSMAELRAMAAEMHDEIDDRMQQEAESA